VNFKKVLLAAAVVALLFPGTAAAQIPPPPPPPVCNIYSAVPPTVRAEGMAELIGDIGIACMQYGEFPLPVQLDLRVTLNVAVTNPRGFGAGPDVTDAQLFTIEQVPCPPCGPPSITGPAYGRLLSNNRLQWLVTAVIPPGTMGQQVYLKIVNIRAQAYGAPSPGPGTPGAITASIELGPGSTPVMGLPFYGLYLAYATPGLIPSLETGPRSFGSASPRAIPPRSNPWARPSPRRAAPWSSRRMATTCPASAPTAAAPRREPAS
jgi:hypothetical protein